MNTIVALPLSTVSIVPLPAFGSNGIDELWLQRLQIIREGHANRLEWRAARAAMPAWARPGHRYVDHQGNPCGEIVSWPEKEVHPGPASSPGAYRVLRVSPHEIRRNFNDYVSMFTSVKDLDAPGRQKARAVYRARMREAINRLRAQRFEEERAGALALEDRSEAIGDALLDVESRIENLPAGLNVTAARLMIEAGYTAVDAESVSRPQDSLRVIVIALEGIRSALFGPIRRSVDALLDNPDRPFGETELALC